MEIFDNNKDILERDLDIKLSQLVDNCGRSELFRNPKDYAIGASYALSYFVKDKDIISTFMSSMEKFGKKEELSNLDDKTDFNINIKGSDLIDKEFLNKIAEHLSEQLREKPQEMKKGAVVLIREIGVNSESADIFEGKILHSS